MSVKGWMLRPWNDELDGWPWVPRLLDKARGALEGERKGHLMNGYLFGDFDYADGNLLKFLRTNDGRVLELLRVSDDDEAVAKTLSAESGRSEDEVQVWSKRSREVNAPFISHMGRR